MTKDKTLRLVTFTLWINEYHKDYGTPKLVSINPVEVSNIEDYCGTIRPGSQVTLKNKKTYLVEGKHEDIVAKLTAKEEGV